MGVDELQRIGWTRNGRVWVAPQGLQEPHTDDLANYTQPAGNTVRPLAPCGTSAAYRRHHRHGETCERCNTYKAMNATRAGTQ